MRVAVIGAGAVGVATAHALAQEGHEVLVFERNNAVAEGASFSNGGLLAPSLAHPLSHPVWPSSSLMRWLKPARAVRWTRGMGWQDLRWLAAWKNAEAQAFRRGLQAASSLVDLSQQLLQSIASERGLNFEAGIGQLVLLRNEADLVPWRDKLAALKEMGVTHALLNPEQTRALEPALAPTQAFHSAIHFAADGFANCRQVTQQLRDLAVDCGTRFVFSTPVESLHAGQGIELRLGDGSTQSFEHVVLATGHSAPLLKAAHLPQRNLALMQSYSLSAQVRETLNTPRNAILDWHSGVTMTRLGLRMRVTGGAELGPTQASQHGPTVRQLFQVLQHHYPGACSFQAGTQVWKGANLYTQDGLPLIGATAIPGLWVNVAHGHNGWGMASGSGQLIADLIARRATATDPAPFAPQRLQ